MAESTINYASYFSAIDLSQLAPPQIIEQLAYTEIFSAVLTDFVARDPSYTVLLESHPAIKVLETGSYREHILRQAFNERAQQLLIAFAVGTNLDHLGAFYSCYRKVLVEADNNVIPAVAQVMESDSDYRKRIQLAPEIYSNAGPMGAYLYHTYDASVGVQNCVVYNASSGLVKPGTVLVVVRIRDGFAASEVTDAVRARLFRDDVKPMTDNVQIKVAQPFNFSVDATLYVNDGPDKTLIRTQARERLVEWVSGAQRRDKIGNRLPWGGISAQLYGPYVERLVMRSPVPGVDIVPGLTQYATMSSLNIQVLKNA